MISVEEVGQLWKEACRDADYMAGVQAVLYIVPSSAENHHPALHVEPGSAVHSESDWPLDRTQIADANSPAKRGTHRIFVREFQSPRVALGRLRHELEHAHQFDRSTNVYRTMEIVQDAVGRAFEEAGSARRQGSATLYNLLPSEEDANRAAARLTTAYFGPPSDEDFSGGDAVLFRDDSPIHPDTLSRRLLTMCALFPTALSWVADRRRQTVEKLLVQLGPEALPAWALLRSPEIAAWGQAATDCSPSEAEINSAPKPALAWAAVVRKVHEGRDAADAMLSTAMPDLNLR